MSSPAPRLCGPGLFPSSERARQGQFQKFDRLAVTDGPQGQDPSPAGSNRHRDQKKKPDSLRQRDVFSQTPPRSISQDATRRETNSRAAHHDRCQSHATYNENRSDENRPIYHRGRKNSHPENGPVCLCASNRRLCYRSCRRMRRGTLRTEPHPQRSGRRRSRASFWMKAWFRSLKTCPFICGNARMQIVGASVDAIIFLFQRPKHRQSKSILIDKTEVGWASCQVAATRAVIPNVIPGEARPAPREGRPRWTDTARSIVPAGCCVGPAAERRVCLAS